MNNKSVFLSVRRSGALAFDILIKTGNLDLRNDIRNSLDKGLRDIKNKTWMSNVWDWNSHSVEDPHPTQGFQKEFIYIAGCTFSGETKEAFKLLNKWVDTSEKYVGKNHLTVEMVSQ